MILYSLVSGELLGTCPLGLWFSLQSFSVCLVSFVVCFYFVFSPSVVVCC